jgi:monoterpene epsilon-lactone hydrolase
MRRSWQSYLVNAWLRVFVKRYTRWRLLSPDAIPDMRVRLEKMGARLTRPGPDVQLTPLIANGVPGEWIAVPESTSRRVILYLHGGGFAFRIPHLHRAMVINWCRRTAAQALIPDYSLAPEQPFPQAVHDCLNAYRWLREQGHEARHLIIAGDSAGGGLTLTVLTALRDAGEALPAGAVILSPAADMAVSGWSTVTLRRQDPMFCIETLLILKNLYLQDALPTHPWASPLYADYQGLPPLLIQAGGYELLLDDARRVAKKAQAAGVAVELEIWQHMPHVFHTMGWLPESQQALTKITRFIRTQIPEAGGL